MAEFLGLLPAVEKTAKIMQSAMEGQPVRHGLGNPSHEKANCPQVHVFMRCVGKVSSLANKQRLLLPADASVGSTRALLEAELGQYVRQEQFVDEDGYAFSKSMLAEPLWRFSSGCRLSLDLKDTFITEVTKDVKGSTKVTAAAWGATLQSVGLGGKQQPAVRVAEEQRGPQ